MIGETNLSKMVSKIPDCSWYFSSYLRWLIRNFLFLQ